MRTRSPERTRSTGGSAASKNPQKHVSGVARSVWRVEGPADATAPTHASSRARAVRSTDRHASHQPRHRQGAVRQRAPGFEIAARLAETVGREYIFIRGLETGQQIGTGRTTPGRTQHAPL
jgi:hypothetical protein